LRCTLTSEKNIFGIYNKAKNGMITLHVVVFASFCFFIVRRVLVPGGGDCGGYLDCSILPPPPRLPL
jgi:hypothetical protein